VQAIIQRLVLLLAILVGLSAAALVAVVYLQEDTGDTGLSQPSYCYFNAPRGVSVIVLNCAGLAPLNGKGVERLELLLGGTKIVSLDLGELKGSKLRYLVYGVFVRDGRGSITAEVVVGGDSRRVYKTIYVDNAPSIELKAMDWLNFTPITSVNGFDTVNASLPSEGRGFLYAVVRPDKLCRELRVLLSSMEDERVIEVSHVVREAAEMGRTVETFSLWPGYVVPLWDENYRSLTVTCSGASIVVDVYEAREAMLRIVYSDGSILEEVIPVIPGSSVSLLAPP
jgi:hypothetical protein